MNKEEILGQIEYFIVHNYQNQKRMFAYIRKIKKLEKSDANLKFFDSFSSLQFVEVISINRNVRFFKVPFKRKKIFYIIDKYANW